MQLKFYDIRITFEGRTDKRHAYEVSHMLPKSILFTMTPLENDLLFSMVPSLDEYI